MSTLGACLIVKDEVERANTLVLALKDHVDAIYMTVSDKKAYNVLKELKNDKIRIAYREWTDDFAAARNSNLTMVQTDYWFWLDADDIIRPIPRLKEVADSMEQEGVDVVFFPYHYKIDELGQTVNLQWRERIVRTSLKGKWLGAIHETFVPEEQIEVRKLDAVAYYHIREIGAEEKSTQRNHKILKALVDKDNPDPRDVYYLALSYFGQEQYDDAIKLFLQHIQTSGWDEEKYYSWCYIAESEMNKKMYDRAISACFGATELLPHYPDAYYILQQIYYEMEKYEKSLEWYSVAEEKPTPKTERVTDPTVKAYRAKFQASMSLLFLGQVKEAWKLINEVRKVQPKDRTINSFYPEYVRAYYEDQVIDKAKWLASYFHDSGLDATKIIEALPDELQLDPRLSEVRREIYPPKVWPKNSIVFYCGAGLEPWGPDTLDKGMGGSEEAIVYLSRELSKLGWQVTVYNDRTESLEDEGVTYTPYIQFNPSDTFDVLVAWRAPALHRILNTKARVRAVDMHDTPLGHQAFSEDDLEHIDKIFLKSQFQKEYSQTKLPDDKVAIVSNGIVLEQFDKEVTRKPHKVIYGSSADRGLNYLLDMWPDIKKEVPDAELVWAYGWNAYDKMHSKNPEQMQWKWQLIRQMKEVGCQSLGRLSHEDLALEFLSSSVWAYPTGFPEINCITAIKAGKSGCIPVTTGYAALQETVLEPQKDWEDVMYSAHNEECVADFKKRLVKALIEGRSEGDRNAKSKEYDKFSWAEIAKDWSKVCELDSLVLHTEKQGL